MLAPMTQDFVVFDLEIIHSPGTGSYDWGRSWELGMSVGVTWSARDAASYPGSEGFRAWYGEPDAEHAQQNAVALLEHMKSFPRVVSFNGIKFDMRVLDGDVARAQGITTRPEHNTEAALRGKSVDLMLDIADCVKGGRFVSLDRVARGTLHQGKSGHGAEAPAAWAAGKRSEVELYCKNDVALSRDIYLAGKRGAITIAPDGKRPGSVISVRWTLR